MSGCSHAFNSANGLDSGLHRYYFVTILRVGATVLVGAIGDSEKVSHVFQPAGRFSAANSPYAFKFKYPCRSPTGNRYPI
jgi:hypothetical protein